MGLPGFPDSLNPGWWRVATVTPPVFTGTGTTSSGSPSVTGFVARYQGRTITPLAGQQVTGAGIPAGATVLASPAPTGSGFTMSADATADGSGVALTVGAEPASLAEAKAWARVLTPDDDSLIGDIVAATRELIEGTELKRALLLQQKALYFMAFPWTGYYSLAIRGMGLNPWWFPFMQGVIQLPYPTLQSVDSVQYIDTNGVLQTMDPSLYVANTDATPGRLQPAYGSTWPIARPQIDAVKITFTCGYGAFSGDVPASVRLAIRSAVASSYENREAFLEGGVLTRSPMFEKFLQAEEWGSYY